MRIAVVDDEEMIRRKIASMISNVYGREDVSCFLYADELDGMSTARKIREFSREIPIVFTTSHTEMAIEGYEVDAFRFLSKPVDETKLRQTLIDLENLLKVDNKIVLREDGEDVVKSVSDLIYAEAANNEVRFVFKGSVVKQRMKFTDAVKLIDEQSRDFVKNHRSYYINLAHVLKLGTGEILMDNKETLPVARGSSASVKKNLFDYIRRTAR